MLADADDVLVLDAPDLWPLLADQPLVLAPYELAGRLADLLDLPLASEEIAGTLDAAGERRPVPAIVAAVLPTPRPTTRRTTSSPSTASSSPGVTSTARSTPSARRASAAHSPGGPANGPSAIC